MIYFIIVVLLLLCVYIYDICKVECNKYIFFYLFVSALIVLNIFSYNIGGDTDGYIYNWLFYGSIFDVNIFREIEIRGIKEQPGWILLTSFLKGICDNFIILRIALACWINLIVAYFIRTNTKLIFTTLLIYFVVAYFNYNFEILRESVAISFFLLAYPFYVGGKWLKYFFCFLLAFLFHESSIVMLILPFFRLLENIQVKKLLLIMVGVYILFLSLNIVNILMAVLPESFMFYEKAYNYMNSEMYGENTGVNMFAFFFASFMLPMFSVFILKMDETKKTLIVIILISMIFSLFTSKMVIFYRFNNYMLLPLAIAYADVFYLLSRKIVFRNQKRLLFIPILLLYISYKVYSIYFKDDSFDRVNGKFYERYYPYASIIDSDREKRKAL